MKTRQQLWKATGINLCLSVVIFGALLGLLWVMELLIPSLQGQFLHFDNAAWVVGIPASIIGVSYILSIKDPENYTGFYAGIVMSVLLGIQFFLQEQYDSTFLYFCVFIPFQIMSIVNWRKPQESEVKQSFEPEFLSMKELTITAFAFIGIVAADYFLATFAFQKNGLSDAVEIKLFNGMLIASSILANYWLIYRKNDAWRYWVIYSLAGIALFVIINNIFSIVLFIFFLAINSMAGIAWFRITPENNYGWINERREQRERFKQKIRK